MLLLEALPPERGRHPEAEPLDVSSLLPGNEKIAAFSISTSLGFTMAQPNKVIPNVFSA